MEILTETNIGWGNGGSVEFIQELEALLLKHCFTGSKLPPYNRVVIETGTGRGNLPVLLQVVEFNGITNITSSFYRSKHR